MSHNKYEDLHVKDQECFNMIKNVWLLIDERFSDYYLFHSKREALAYFLHRNEDCFENNENVEANLKESEWSLKKIS